MKVKLGSFFAVGGGPPPGTGPGIDGPAELEVPEGCTVEGLVRQLNLLGRGVDPDDVMFFVYINGHEKSLDHKLQAGDTIDLHVPAMGG